MFKSYTGNGNITQCMYIKIIEVFFDMLSTRFSKQDLRVINDSILWKIQQHNCAMRAVWTGKASTVGGVQVLCGKPRYAMNWGDIYAKSFISVFFSISDFCSKSNLDNVGYISELVWHCRVDLCLVVVVIFAIIIINIIIIIITTYFECVTLIAVIMHMFCGAHIFIGETICILWY